MNELKSPEEAEVSPSPEELYIETDTYNAAMKRATQQGETLASVTRACYYAAAALAVPVPGGRDLLKPREYGVDRERIRFQVPAAKKKATRAAIEASGVRVPEAVEKLLKIYVETGTIVRVAAAPEPEHATDTNPESE